MINNIQYQYKNYNNETDVTNIVVVITSTN